MSEDQLGHSETPAGADSNQVANAVLAKSQSRVRSYLDSREEWNTHRSLKNLIEQAVRDYEHRALVELLQNAHDAQPRESRTGRILIRLDYDEGDHGVLHVANSGVSFTKSNFDSICDVAQSDKRPDEGIGNKGIGFKSVLQLCRIPEIYSASHDNDEGFNGYCFRFAGHDDFAALASWSKAQVNDLESDLFHLCLPVPLLETPSSILDLRTQDYVTVIRLPLKSASALAEAEAEIRALESSPPSLLFLSRIAVLTIEERRNGGLVSRVHERREELVRSHSSGLSILRIDLGEAGRFVLAQRVVDPDEFRSSIDASIETERISDAWREWEGEARVSVAVPVDDNINEGNIYTFLPMGPNARAPIAAHVDAPFFSKLARIDFEEGIPLNDFLLDQVADLCAETILLISEGLLPLPPEMTIDLLCWASPSHKRLSRAFEARGLRLDAAPVIPLHYPKGSWSNVKAVQSWPSTFTVLSRDNLSRLGKAQLVHDSIEDSRLERLVQFARLIAGRDLKPMDTDLAGWAEMLAASAAKRSFKRSWWESFYDELSHAIKNPDVLRGRRILLDDDLKLQRCADPDETKRRAATPFFFPRIDETAEGEGTVDLRIPASLKSQIFFVNQEIRWNVRSGQTTTKRLGRRFLENGRLVNEYRATELFPVLSRALRRSPSNTRSLESLRWVYRFANSREEVPWKDIREVGLRVPTRGGEWILASNALFSDAWQDEESTMLEELIARVGSQSPAIAELSNRMILPPDQWPFSLGDTTKALEFLEQIGVRRGLWPDQLPRSVISREGRWFEDLSAITSVPMASESQALWRQALVSRAPSHLRPYTNYLSSAPQYQIPGQEHFNEFDDKTKRIFSQLIVCGLENWPDSTLEVGFHRYNNVSDTFAWPTPAYAFLEQAEWLPMANAKERNAWYFISPRLAWSHNASDEAAPNFAPLLPAAIRRLIDPRDRARSRLEELGLSYWDSPKTAPARLRLLAELLEQDAIPEVATASFKKAYEAAWAETVDHGFEDPFLGHADSQLVVTRKTALDLIPLSEGPKSDSIYVQDADEVQTLRLLEHQGIPLVRARHEFGQGVAELLAPHFGERLRRVSEAEITVQVDGSLFRPGELGELLINEKRAWLLDLIASILELRSGSFRRLGKEAVRRTIERTRQIRIVLADTFETLVDGQPVDLQQAGGRVLALPDNHAPTIILQRQNEMGESLLLERAASGIAELTGYPDLGATLRVALIDLFRRGWEDGDSPSLANIAQAIGEPVERLLEIREDLRQPIDQLRQILVPIVATFDIDMAKSLWDSIETMSHADEVVAWLEKHEVDLGIAASHVVSLCSTDDLNFVRSNLNIPLPRLNEAISNLGPPFREIRNVEGIERSFRSFVLANRESIISAVRAVFYPTYKSGGNLNQYRAYRDLQGLIPHPQWAEDYYEVEEDIMRAEVEEWLAACGASLTAAETWPPIDELRLKNRVRMLELVQTASILIGAWERKREQGPTPILGDAGPMVEEASVEGILDFEEVNENAIIDWFSRTGRWPEGMPRSLKSIDLGLSDQEVRLAEETRDENSRRQRELGSVIFIDGQEFNAEQQNYSSIVEAVRASVTGGFLATPPKVLDLAQQVWQRRAGQRSQGRGTTAARRPRLSPAQQGAIGLAGEVVALQWLKANYPLATDASWRSGYRNLLLGGSDGDDSLGYDFEVLGPKIRLLFEVKSTTGDTLEFDLTDAEIRAAQRVRRGEHYFILFVTHVLQGDDRSIHLLPNPFGKEGIGRYRTIGSGLRLRFDFN